MNSTRNTSKGLVTITALMLFSMFFGAGNLIFPPLLGAQAGENFVPAMIGFLLTGVLMPVLAVVALALTGADLKELASRGGLLFTLLFPPLVYLSIGALYALPRTGVVSYSMAIAPNFNVDGPLPVVIFSAIFFGLSYLMALNPSGIVDTLGKYLTPALVLLLALLVIMGIITLTTPIPAPAENYASSPLAAGFVSGYLTMDTLAALAFGILVVTSMKDKGVTETKTLTRSISLAGVIAGILLGLVYLGLAYIGLRLEGAQGYEDGAMILTTAAAQVLGRPGAIIFGAIVLLACLTTAVGLVGSSSAYFHKIIPAVSYRAWLGIFTLLAFVLASFGLQSVMSFAIPVITTLYPPAVTLVLLAIAEVLFKAPWFHYTYRFSLAVATLWALLMTLASQGIATEPITALIGWAPGHAQELGWALPTLLAVLAGLLLDFATRRKAAVAA